MNESDLKRLIIRAANLGWEEGLSTAEIRNALLEVLEQYPEES
jgi:hypothetical protein